MPEHCASRPGTVVTTDRDNSEPNRWRSTPANPAACAPGVAARRRRRRASAAVRPPRGWRTLSLSPGARRARPAIAARLARRDGSRPPGGAGRPPGHGVGVGGMVAPFAPRLRGHPQPCGRGTCDMLGGVAALGLVGRRVATGDAPAPRIPLSASRPTSDDAALRHRGRAGHACPPRIHPSVCGSADRRGWAVPLTARLPSPT